jgi:hypothetical protein
MLSITMLYVVLVIVLPLVLSAAISYRGLPEGRSSPRGAGETMRLQARWLPYVRLIGGRRLHARWCPRCGWEGVARVTEESPSRRRVGSSAPQPVAAAPRPQFAELRVLEVDGRPWRVLLQSWTDGAFWRGQLLFVGPLGRLCSDGVAPFSGASYHDVLRQAMAMSEQVLAGRLREVISE